MSQQPPVSSDPPARSRDDNKLTEEGMNEQSKWVGVPEGQRNGPPQMGARRPPPPAGAPPPRSSSEEGRGPNISPARTAPARPPPARTSSVPAGVSAVPPAARGRGPSGLIAPPARRLPPSRAASEEPTAEGDAARKAIPPTRNNLTQEMPRPDSLPAPLAGATSPMRAGRGRGRGTPNPKAIPPPRAPPPRTNSQSKFPARAAPPPPIQVTPPTERDLSDASPIPSPKESPELTPTDMLRSPHGTAPPPRPRPQC